MKKQKKKVKILKSSLLQLLEENQHLSRQITELQSRGTELTLENRELKKEVVKLQDGIRKHRDADGHNLCWYVPELWDLLPDKKEIKLSVPPEDEFLSCCRIYRDSLG
jgi:predicted  nucleic acid-binding Zn-ribbon protein